MAIMSEAVLRNIREIAVGGASRQERATAIADAIRNFGRYRWVGIYDVDAEFVAILAWSGSGPPAHPRFPVIKGLTGSAISQKTTVVVGDVRKDSRYLTAFGSTLSEIIIPVIRAQGQTVIGTIDVESDRLDAFFDEDQKMLEQCAISGLPLWGDASQAGARSRR